MNIWNKQVSMKIEISSLLTLNNSLWNTKSFKCLYIINTWVNDHHIHNCTTGLHWIPILVCINPLTPGVFQKKLIFQAFLTFSGLESAKIASNQSKPHLKRRTRHCISLEARAKVKVWDSFGAINHPTTLGFSFFLTFFCSLSSFLFFLFFCCSCWTSTRLLLSSRISQKALTRQEILAMDKQRVKRGNFPLSFLSKL